MRPRRLYWVTAHDFLPPYRRASVNWQEGWRPVDTAGVHHFGPFRTAEAALDKVSALFGTTAAEYAASQFYGNDDTEREIRAEEVRIECGQLQRGQP